MSSAGRGPDLSQITGIVVRVRCTTNRQGLSAEALSRSLRRVRDAVIDAEEQELSRYVAELDLDETPLSRRELADLLRNRMAPYKGRSLVITEVGSGSIIWIGLVGAVVLWIVDRTLGETMKEAWKESRLHRQLKGLSIKVLDEKLHAILNGVLKKEPDPAITKMLPPGVEPSRKEGEVVSFGVRAISTKLLPGMNETQEESMFGEIEIDIDFEETEVPSTVDVISGRSPDRIK